MTNTNKTIVAQNKGEQKMDYSKMKKADLIALLEQKEAEKQEKSFNIWNDTYRRLVKEFIKSGEQTEFSINIRHWWDNDFKNKETGENVHIDGAGKVLRYLYKLGALKLGERTETTDENGKLFIQVKIKNFDIKAKKAGQFGEYEIFKKDYNFIKSLVA